MNMSYCRHNNTANDLEEVIDTWDEFDPDDTNEYELRGRIKIIRLIREFADCGLDFDAEIDRCQKALEES